MDVGGHAAVVARILYFAVGDFAGDHAVRHGHCVVVLGQLSLVLEPFDLNHTTSTVFSLRTIQPFIFDLLLKIEEDKKIKNEQSTYRRSRLAAQTAKEFACLLQLNDTRTQHKGEGRSRLLFVLPDLDIETLATTHRGRIRYELRDLLWYSCAHK